MNNDKRTVKNWKSGGWIILPVSLTGWICMFFFVITNYAAASAPSAREVQIQTEEEEKLRHQFLVPDDFDYPYFPLILDSDEAVNELSESKRTMPSSRAGFATFAIAALANRHFENSSQIELAVERMLAFRPRTVLILNACDDPLSRQAREKLEKMTDSAAGPGVTPHLVMPDPEKILQIIPWNNDFAWLYLNPTRIETASEQELEAALDELRERILPRRGSRIVLCTGNRLFRRTEKNRSFWYRLQWLLDQNNNEVRVVLGGAGNFSWWREGELEFFSVPDIAGGLDRRMDLAAGQFNGILWGYMDSVDEKIRFRAVALSGILDHREIARDDQQIVEILNASLKATAFTDTRPLTTVTLRNTTEHRLEFSARWEAEGGIEIDPRVVSFTLEPEQVFSQQFRLNSPSSRPLKFLAPRFTLQTDIPGPGGIPREVDLQAVPWGRLSTAAPFKDNPITVDGKFEDWGQTGIQLNHRMQVISGREFWQGPADLSAVVKVGYDHENLYVGVKVVDGALNRTGDQIEIKRQRISVHLFPGPPAMLESKEEKQPEELPLLSLHAEPNGTVEAKSRTPGFVPASLESAVIKSETGYAAEFAVPRQTFPDNIIPAQLLMDVVVESFESPSEGLERGTKMQLSGHGLDSRLFAVVQLEEAPRAETTED